MDLTLTPDTYVPILNNGNYVDKVPNIQNGIYCPCGSRHNKVYNHQTSKKWKHSYKPRY